MPSSINVATQLGLLYIIASQVSFSVMLADESELVVVSEQSS